MFTVVVHSCMKFERSVLRTLQEPFAKIVVD